MTDRTARLLTLASRCEQGEPSRLLDAEIHCAVYHIVDFLGAPTDETCRIWAGGEVMVRDHRGSLVDAFYAPPYTTDSDAANTLYAKYANIHPDDALRRCAFALRSLASEDLLWDMPAHSGHRMTAPSHTDEYR